MTLTNPETITMPIYPDLRGKIAVVTGGSKGIGAATSRALAANGVRVAVIARSQEGIDGIVDEIRRSGGEAIGIRADCTASANLTSTRHTVESAFGPVDILIAFAGGFGSYTPVQDIPEEEWHDVIDSNLTSTFLTVKTYLPGMIERGSGSIVTMASGAGRYLDIPLTASYAAAKAGIVMFTRHVALEVGKHGIRANCVAPATTFSERIERIMTAERIDAVSALSPLGRLGFPTDTALATLYLVSDSAAWVTGITLDVAGGRIML